MLRDGQVFAYVTVGEVQPAIFGLDKRRLAQLCHQIDHCPVVAVPTNQDRVFDRLGNVDVDLIVIEREKAGPVPLPELAKIVPDLPRSLHLFKQLACDPVLCLGLVVA